MVLFGVLIRNGQLKYTKFTSFFLGLSGVPTAGRWGCYKGSHGRCETDEFKWILPFKKKDPIDQVATIYIFKKKEKSGG